MPDISNARPSPELPPAMAMLQMVTSYRISQSIYVAAKLGIADLVRDAPKHSEELAIATQTHAPSLYRVLRALASVGLFAEDDCGRFSLTPLAACLQKDAEDSMLCNAIVRSEDLYRKPWGQILHSVKTGETAFRHAHGMELFDYLVQHPDAAALFDGAMTNYSATILDALLVAYDFSGIGTLVDVGGGQGSLLAGILKAYPTMQGILFEQAAAIERAKSLIAAEGMTERCHLKVGNFFESVPEGGDAYILKNIIHDWNDEQAIAILRNCHHAMAERATLLLVEGVIFPGNESSYAKLLDVEMLVLTGGIERTESQHRALLKAAGFHLQRMISTTSWQSILEAVRT